VKKLLFLIKYNLVLIKYKLRDTNLNNPKNIMSVQHKIFLEQIWLFYVIVTIPSSHIFIYWFLPIKCYRHARRSAYEIKKPLDKHVHFIQEAIYLNKREDINSHLKNA
jgi:hypothetical protein